MAADTVVTETPITETAKAVTVVNQFADDPTNPNDATGALVGTLPAVIKESKAGYKTTEFWASLIASLLIVFEVVPATGDTEGILVAVITALYAASRGFAKKGQPHVEVTKVEAPAA